MCVQYCDEISEKIGLKRDKTPGYYIMAQTRSGGDHILHDQKEEEEEKKKILRSNRVSNDFPSGPMSNRPTGSFPRALHCTLLSTGAFGGCTTGQ